MYLKMLKRSTFETDEVLFSGDGSLQAKPAQSVNIQSPVYLYFHTKQAL